jgi:hypothetical protein
MSEKNAEIEDIRNAIHPRETLVDREGSMEVTVVRWASVPTRSGSGAVQMKNRMRVSDPTLCVAWDAYIFLRRKSYQ